MRWAAGWSAHGGRQAAWDGDGRRRQALCGCRRGALHNLQARDAARCGPWGRWLQAGGLFAALRRLEAARAHVVSGWVSAWMSSFVLFDVKE